MEYSEIDYPICLPAGHWIKDAEEKYLQRCIYYPIYWLRLLLLQGRCSIQTNWNWVKKTKQPVSNNTGCFYFL